MVTYDKEDNIINNSNDEIDIEKINLNSLSRRISQETSLDIGWKNNIRGKLTIDKSDLTETRDKVNFYNEILFA